MDLLKLLAWLAVLGSLFLIAGRVLDLARQQITNL